MASEEEATIVVGTEEAGRPLTATARASEGSSAEDVLGVEAVGRGTTADTTSAVTDKAGARVRHGAKTAARERISSKSYGVVG